MQNLESEEEKMTEISYKQKLEQLLEKCPHDKFYNNCMKVVENLSTLQKVWINVFFYNDKKYLIEYESRLSIKLESPIKKKSNRNGNQRVVAGEFFSSDKQLRKRCQQILHGHKIRENLPDADTRFLTSLIRDYHSEPEVKIGVGVKRMWVDKSDHPTNCFYLERIDGTITEWSFNDCIKNKSKWCNFKDACRNAIRDQTISYKVQRFQECDSIQCCLTGEELFFGTSHVDHVPPKTFDAILKMFLQTTGIDYNNVLIDPTHDNVSGCWLSDANFVKQWSDFHRKNAVFRLVSRTGNLSYSKREANAMKGKM